MRNSGVRGEEEAPEEGRKPEGLGKKVLQNEAEPGRVTRRGEAVEGRALRCLFAGSPGPSSMVMLRELAGEGRAGLEGEGGWEVPMAHTGGFGRRLMLR